MARISYVQTKLIFCSISMPKALLSQTFLKLKTESTSIVESVYYWKISHNFFNNQKSISSKCQIFQVGWWNKLYSAGRTFCDGILSRKEPVSSAIRSCVLCYGKLYKLTPANWFLENASAVDNLFFFYVFHSKVHLLQKKTLFFNECTKLLGLYLPSAPY